MQDDPIKAALREATATLAPTTCGQTAEWHRSRCSPCLCQKNAAAAIEAFLRAVPTAWVRATYGADEAVFKNLLHEAVARENSHG